MVSNRVVPSSAGRRPSQIRSGFRVAEPTVDPVGGGGRPVEVPGARQQDRRRAVRRGVLEDVAPAPGNAAALIGGPCGQDLSGQHPDRAAVLGPAVSVAALQRQGQPGHVVVVVVRPASPVQRPDPAAQPADPASPVRSRVADLGVHQAVQQMGLPPVVPTEEDPVQPGGRPAVHAEFGARHGQRTPGVPGDDGPFGLGRPVCPATRHVRGQPRGQSSRVVSRRRAGSGRNRHGRGAASRVAARPASVPRDSASSELLSSGSRPSSRGTKASRYRNTPSPINAMTPNAAHCSA